MRLARRQFLQAAAAGAVLTGLPGRARAAVSPADRKFVFVHAYGGWDVTRAFVPAFDNPLVDMEATAVAATVGGIPFVDEPARPSVRAFLEAWHDRTLVWNGINVPSIGHVECVRLAMTGDSTGTSPDWATLLASGAADRYPLPHVVVSGPQFPGTLGSLVTRIGTGGQTPALLDGSILAQSDLAVPASPSRATLAAFVQARSEMRSMAATGDRQRALVDAYAAAHRRALALEGYADDVRWDTDGTLPTQAALAVDLLRLDAARCVTIAYGKLETWDSHADNDSRQSANFEGLFAGLAELCAALDATPGPRGGTLADEVIVVVMSEMARTPQLNSGAGKDHWGTTTAMLVGPGVAGDRVIGAYGEYFYGEAINFATGEVAADGRQVAGGDFGATLLALGDVDPAAALPDQTVVDAAIDG